MDAVQLRKTFPYDLLIRDWTDFLSFTVDAVTTTRMNAGACSERSTSHEKTH